MKPQKKTNRFHHSFRRVVNDLETDHTCELKRHYRGLMREVVGYLDLQAAKRRDRFVFAGVDDILEHCKRFKGERYKSKRLVEYALAELRARRIISKRLTRLNKHVEYSGFIVAPHNCLAARQSERHCVFTGYQEAACWKQENETGPFFWAGSKCAECCAVHCAGVCAVHCAVKCAEQCAVKCADGTSAQPNVKENVNCENRAIAVGTGSVVGAERAVGPDTTEFNPSTPGSSQAEIENPNPNPKGENQNPAGESRSLSTTDQKQNVDQNHAHVARPKPITIAEHFSTRVTMAEITDGEFEETEISKQEDGDDLKTLCEICDEIINAMGALNYLGQKTNGDIMAKAMVRFTKESNSRKEVPRYWYPIVLRLREFPAAPQFPKPAEPAKPEPEVAFFNALVSMLSAAKLTTVFDEAGYWKTDEGKACWEWIQKNAPGKLTKREVRALLFARWRELPKLLLRLRDMLVRPNGYKPGDLLFIPDNDKEKVLEAAAWQRTNAAGVLQREKEWAEQKAALQRSADL